MITVVITNCPPKLRGDISKWLFEINTGVYVGKVSARVRDLLWERICENINQGQATMIFPAQGEQKMEFRVHNTSWEIVDFDGLKLMRRPNMHLKQNDKHFENNSTQLGFSREAKNLKIQSIQKAKKSSMQYDNYTVIDVETTGLSHLTDSIIEIAALRIRNGLPKDELNFEIKCDKSIPKEIEKLTGLTTEYLIKEGRDLENALKEFIEFLNSDLIICYNAPFDYGFIQAACKKLKISQLRNKYVDAHVLAKRKIKEVSDYKLQTVAKYFLVDTYGSHRALRDCYITYGIFKKLNEI